MPLGYVEQLYTFADQDRTQDGHHRISISYLGPDAGKQAGQLRRDRLAELVRIFPWEDHRTGAPPIIRDTLLPRLAAWAAGEGRGGRTAPAARRHHVRHRRAVERGTRPATL